MYPTCLDHNDKHDTFTSSYSDHDEDAHLQYEIITIPGRPEFLLKLTSVYMKMKTLTCICQPQSKQRLLGGL